VELTQDLRLYYRRAWAAYTSESPLDINARCADTSVPDPDIVQAFRLMLLRYPGLRSGLPRWEMRLLRSVLNGAQTAGEVMADALGRRDQRDAMKDYVLLDTLTRLSDGTWSDTFVTVESSPCDYGSRVELTPSGRAVAEGRARAALAEHARLWIGGVCLPRAGAWVHDEGHAANAGKSGMSRSRRASLLKIWR